jgi:hypothetical protein
MCGQFFIFLYCVINRSGGYNRRYSLGLGGKNVVYNPPHTGRDTCIYILDTDRGADNYMSSLFY